jgi:hypothetical protein
MSKIISALAFGTLLGLPASAATSWRSLRRAFSLRTRAQAVPRMRVTPTAIPTAMGPHIANIIAVAR